MVSILIKALQYHIIILADMYANLIFMDHLAERQFSEIELPSQASGPSGPKNFFHELEVKHTDNLVFVIIITIDYSYF